MGFIFKPYRGALRNLIYIDSQRQPPHKPPEGEVAERCSVIGYPDIHIGVSHRLSHRRCAPMQCVLAVCAQWMHFERYCGEAPIPLRK